MRRSSTGAEGICFRVCGKDTRTCARGPTRRRPIKSRGLKRSWPDISRRGSRRCSNWADRSTSTAACANGTARRRRRNRPSCSSRARRSPGSTAGRCSSTTTTLWCARPAMRSRRAGWCSKSKRETDFVKCIYDGEPGAPDKLPRAALQAIVKAAHERGKSVLVHIAHQARHRRSGRRGRRLHRAHLHPQRSRRLDRSRRRRRPPGEHAAHIFRRRSRSSSRSAAAATAPIWINSRATRSSRPTKRSAIAEPPDVRSSVPASPGRRNTGAFSLRDARVADHARRRSEDRRRKRR